MPPTPDESQDLRRCVRDLVALSTLPAIWGNADTPGVGRGLAEVLLRVLSADFVYVRLRGGTGGASEALRTRHRTEPEGRAREVGQALAPWLRPDAADAPPRAPNPVGEGTVRLAVFPVGHGHDHGLLAAGCTRPDFPTETERLLLGVAVNQAAGLLQQKEAEEQLRRSERELSDFFENASVGLHWVGPAGTILRVNRAELDLLGYAPEEYVGRNIAEFHADRAVIADMMRRLSAGETLRDYPARMRCKDGSIKHVLIDSSVLWEDGRFVHTRCFTRDVTACRAAEEALREEDRRKDEFLAMLAHELRNPLAPIRNGLQVLKRARGDAETAEQARGMMERQLQHLVRLVDDLLDVSRISRGKFELRKERIDLAAIVASAREASDPLVEQREHELTVSLPEEPVFVEGDLTRLAQVVSNLLNNAAKYTERGGRIALEVRRQGGEAVLSVKDTGVGIPPEMLPKVFELFTQVDRTLEKAQGGLGIGLTLVKRLVEMHGGSVEARSEAPGRGSEFVVRLPAAEALPAPERTRGDGGAAAPRQRVLVVDDSRDGAESLAMLLRLTGNEVRTAHDGLEAVEVAAAYRPDLILMDVGMPRLNGLDATRRIREQPWGKGVVIVALTGWGQDGDRRRTTEAGCDGHLVKPVEHGELEKLLATLTRRTV